MTSDGHTAAFLAALGEPARARLGADPGLAAILADCLARACAAWPDLRVDAARFLAFLAERVPPDAVDAAALTHLRVEDLCLACAAADGDAGAVAAVSALIAGLAPALARLDLGGAGVDEVLQGLRERLLVGAGIAAYAGRGDLRGWLRSVAVHAGLKQLRHERRYTGLEDETIAAASRPGDDPELERLRLAYASQFRAAFRQAMASLSARQRNLLRQHYLDGLSIDQLGVLHRVHRATAARQVAAIRQLLLARTQRNLMHELRVDRSELDSILRLVGSQLDASIHEQLRG
jgi:RNA polymerase sigma-70 factor, ECF subfamily